jgi:hypothetical protein
MTQAKARDRIYRGRRFEGEIIELCVRWYITYPLPQPCELALIRHPRMHQNPRRVFVLRSKN